MIDGLARRIADGRINDAPKPARLLEEIISDTSYAQWLTRDEGSESPENSRVSNVRELVRAAERFRTVDELIDYVDTVLSAARRAARDGEADRVTLMSIHRSKGLEWPHVYLVGCNDKILPHGRADLVEERRLFYVAVTRARDVLEVSSVSLAVVANRVAPLARSQFLAEAGIEMNDPDPNDPDTESSDLVVDVKSIEQLRMEAVR